MRAEVYPLGYVIASALAAVTINSLVSNVNPTLILWMVTTIAIIYFNIINYRAIKHVYASLIQEPILSCSTNVSLAINWAATYLGISYLGASVYNIYYFTLTSVFASLVPIRRNQLNFFAMMFLLIGAGILLKLPLYGLLTVFLGGLSGFLYRKSSFHLAKNRNLSGSQLLAMRFWVLWVILFFIAPLDKINQLSLTEYLSIFFVAFASFILQNWLNQQGIIKAGVRKSTLILSWTPLATLLAQFLILKEFSTYWLILASICQASLFYLSSKKSKNSTLT